MDTAKLLAWLRDELGRPDLGVLLEQLLDDRTLDDDLRLLRFCRALWPNMPPTWRGLSLSEADLYNMACAAERGDRTALEWLESLQDGRCFAFYIRAGYSDIERMANQFRETLEQFDRCWNEMIEAGAPIEMRQNDREALPTVIATAFSDERRVSLRRELGPFMDPAAVLLCEEWFTRFGTDLRLLTGPQLLILRHLSRRAFANERVYESIDRLGAIDWSDPGSDVIVPDSLRALSPGLNLVVRPGVIPFDLRPGDIHRPDRNRTLGGRLAAWLGPIARRIGAALIRRRRPDADTDTEPSTVPEILATVRLVRATAGSRGEPYEVRDECYYALVSWQVSQELPVWIELDHLCWFFRVPGLRYGPLPSTGRALLLLTTDTDLRIAAGRSLFRRSRTSAIGIRFEPQEPLLRPNVKPLKTQQAWPHSEEELQKHTGELLKVNETSLPVNKITIEAVCNVRRHSPDFVRSFRGTPISPRKPARKEREVTGNA